MRTMSISIPDKQADRVVQAVDSGNYASNSEVVRDALRLWEQREEVRAIELARLKQAYVEGMASGPGREVTADALLAGFREKSGRRG